MHGLWHTDHEAILYRGWEQMEVTCNPNRRDKKAMWSVEEITDHRCELLDSEVDV